MNRIYRSIWNQATGAYAAVSENVKSAGKRSLPGSSGGGAHFALTSMAAALMLGYGSLALAGPTGGNVVAGQATINGAPGSTVINQGSQNAVINWASFNVGKGESVQFVQPNSNAVALNRVLGSDGTSILGNLSANGKVFIVNPNGILFGKGASVNTAGLVASTLDISNSDFMSGKYQFNGNGTGKVLNQGSISAPGGYVALLGANVSNEGTIQARLGSVALAAGRAITLDVAGDGLLNVAINEGAVGALVNNGGLIQADGGSVLLSAQAAGDLLKTVVNNTGIIEARSIDTRGGTIKLLGDMQSGTVNAAGTLDASAPTGGNGGFIDTSAAHVKIDDALKVTSAAAKGLSGTWLIDPTDFNIAVSGGDMTGAVLSNSLKSANIQIQSVSGSGGTSGNINVNDTISWSANKLTLTAQNNININTAMRGSGTASLALEYGQSSAAGTGSTYNVKAAVDLPSGNNFSTKQGSSGLLVNYKVINALGASGSTTANDLQGINGGLNGNYVLGSNIDASSTSTWTGGGFSPIGHGDAPLGSGNATPFTGRFDGLGHVVSGLTINRANAAIGMFGVIGSSASVSNLGLEGGTVSGSSPVYLGDFASAGMLAGINRGLVNNVYSTGAVNGSGYSYIGGLVGKNTGSISNSRAGGAVVSAGYYGGGGLVGNNAAGATVTNSSASGTVTSDTSGSAGGLIGFNYGLISQSFATGAVSGGQRAGGLTAYNRYQGTGPSQGIEYSYATGTVTAHSNVGGLVGENDNAKISNSYSTSTVTGTPGNGASGDMVGGLVGFNQSGGTIINSYSTGNVSGGNNVGGVVGWNNQTSGTGGVRSTLTSVYSSGKVTGVSNVGGVAGQNSAPNGIVNGIYNSTLNTGAGIGANSGTATITGLSSTQMKSASNFTGFNFTTTAGALGNNWVMVNADGSFNSTTGTGATLPMLASEWSNTITSVHQLQLMGMNLTAQYVLANDIAAATTASSTLDVWTGGSFIPVGASGATPFAGSFDGAGHTIYGLVVNRPGIDYAGLFGATASGAYVANVGLEGGSISGGNHTGALVGSNAGTVNGSFSTVSVTGASQVGGLVGDSAGTISNSYASGAVSGTNISGGLVGASTGTLTNNYANGAVSGTSNAGGLAGSNSGASSGNFWDTAASGKASSATGTGLSTAQLKTLSVFSAAGWDLGGTWIVYDGNSTPLLRSFMTPLYVNFNGSASKTYDGTSTWTAPTYTYSNLTDGRLQGTMNYGAAGGAINAGTYAITAGGLYSGQHGYLITSNAATLTIAQRAATLSGASVINRAYDGTSNASLSGGTLSGLLAQDVGNVQFDTGVFANKNVGNGIAVAAMGTGSAGGNYAITASAPLTGNITPKALTLDGLSVVSKQYDGGTAATFTGGSLTGLVSGETLNLAASTGTYAGKDVGTGKAVAVTLGTLADGTGLASNYTLAAPTGITGDITARVLTISGMTAGSKIYDGTTDVILSGGVLNNLVSGETLGFSGSTGAFSDKNAGNVKSVAVSGTVLQSGTGLASNYTISNPVNITANISKATIGSVSGIIAGNKVYDGSVAASLNTAGAAFAGMLGGDSLTVSNASGSFSDKNAGAGKAVAISGITLGGTDAGNYNLTTTTASSTADISKASITGVSGIVAGNKVYDGTINASLNTTGASFAGMVGGDSLTVSNASGSFSDKNAGNGKTVNVSGIVLGGADVGNYNLASGTSSATANISKATIGSVTGIVAGNKVYDGSVAASLNSAGASFAGMLGGDSLTVSNASGSFSDKNAGVGKSVAISGITLGGTDAGNYNLTTTTASSTGDISKASISGVSGIVAGNKVYDGSVAASLNTAGAAFAGMLGGDSLTVSNASGSFSDKNAGTGKSVAISGIVLGGTDAGNYNLASNTTSSTANISAKALTLTGLNGDKVYDATLNATLVGGTLNGLVNSETLGFSAQGNYSDKNVGSNKAITVNGMTLSDGTGMASNYTLATPAGVTGTITKATISSITGLSALNKIYNGNLNVSLSPAFAVINGKISGDDVQLFSANGAFTDKNVGNNKTVNISNITLSGGDLGNYNFTNNTATALANITPKSVTLTGVTAGNKIYDGTTAAVLSGGTLTGLVSGETLSFSGGVGTFNDKNVGTGKVVTINGTVLQDGTGLASNYTFTSPGNVSAAISKATISSVSNVGVNNKTYDGLDTAMLNGAGTFNGMVNGDSLAVTGNGTFSDKNAGTGKTVAVSGLVLTGTDAGNYNLTNTKASTTADITPKALTVTGATAATRNYDGTVDATLSGGSLTGLIGSEALVLNSVSGAFVDKNAGTNKDVNISGGSLGDGVGGLASNYTISSSVGGKGTITPKALTVTGVTAANRDYDSTLVATLTGGTLSGLVAGETLTLDLTKQTGAFGDKNVGNDKVVTVTGATVTNDTGQTSNYAFSNASGVTANISKATISSVSNVGVNSKTYDGLDTAALNGAGTFNGMMNGDSLAVTGNGTFSDKNAGTGKTVAVSGLTLTGTDAGNYNLADTKASTTADISKATISSVSNVGVNNKTYDGLDTAMLNGAGTFNGMVNGDSLAVTGNGTFSDKNAGTGKTVAVSGLVLTGTDAGNYNLTNTKASTTADITPKALTVTGATAATRNYDGTVDATLSGGSLTGLIGSEKLVLNSVSGAFVDKNAGNNKDVNITGGSLGNGVGGLASNYTVGSGVGGTGTITPKALTVSGATAATRNYDGTFDATLSGGSLTGLIGSEKLVLNSVSGAFVDKNAGTNKDVNISGGSLGDGVGGLASNYTVGSGVGGTGTITPKALTVSGATAATRNYDGTLDATVSGGSLTGLIGSEKLVLNSVSGAFVDKNAGNNKDVNITGGSLGNGVGGLASNYTVGSGVGGTGTITPKALTVSGATAATRNYDGTLDATLSGGSLTGLIGSEALVLNNVSGAFVDKNAGNNKDVNITGGSLGNGVGGLASNYTVGSGVGGTGTITPKALTVSGATAATRNYDGTLDATVSGGSLTGLIGSEALVLNNVSGAFVDKNAGNNKDVNITGGSLGDGVGGLASNYTISSSVGGKGTITPKALTVTGVTAANRDYDSTLVATLTGGTLSGLVAGETLTLDLTKQTGAFGDKNVGNDKVVTVTGATLTNDTGLTSNYAFSNASGVTANISKATINSVGGIVAGNKVYDGGTAASLNTGSASFDGIFSNDNLTVTNASGGFSDKNAATGKTVNISGIALGGNDAGNYNLADTKASTTADISKATINSVGGIVAGNKVYDGGTVASLNTGSASFDGIISNDNLTVANASGSFSDKNAANGKTVSISGIALGGSDAGNYNLADTKASTTADISKATINSVGGIVAGNKVYDGNATASLNTGSASFDGIISNDNLTVANASGSFSDKNAANGKTVSISGIALGGTDAGNYNLASNTSSTTASITAKALTVVGQVAGNKVYDGNAVAQLIGGSLSGLVGSETLGIGGQSAAFSDQNAANAKVVTVTGTTLLDGSGSASNYTVTNPTGLTASITPKALTVVGQVAGNKVYDGNAVAQLNGGSLSGLVGSESLGFGGQTAAFSDQNAATAKAVTVSGTTLLDGSGLASNYTVANPTGLTASITPKALTVVGQVVGNKVYDGNAVANLIGGSLSGLIGSETLAIAGQTAAFSDKNVGNAKAVTVTGTALLDTLNGLASNYTVTNPTGLTASITPKALTVVGQVAGNKVYDGNAVAQLNGGSLSGLVGSETLTIGGQSAAFSDQNAANAKAVTVTGTTLLDGSGSASNYTVTNPTGLTASITPKALTVVGQVAGNKVYDGNAVAQLNGGSLSGLVGSESLGFGGQTAAFSDQNAATAKAVTVSGTTLLDGSGLASNYTVTNPTGLTASITPKALTVVGQVAGNKVYDGNAVANLIGGSLSGLIGSETLAIGGQTAAFSDKNVGNAKAVTVTGTALLDTLNGLASNYTVTNPTGLTASITPKVLTVVGQVAGNKVYDGNTVAQLIGGSLSGLIGGETLTIAGQSAAFSDKNVANAKAVTVTGTTLLDTLNGQASNYTVTNPTGLTASITPASISGISGIVAANKVYDSSTAASLNLSGATFNGMVAGDTLTLASGPVVGAFSDKNVATGKNVTIRGLGLGGSDAGNYVLASNQASTTANITPATLTVSASGSNKVYDATTNAIVSLRDNRIGNDQLTIASSGASFSDKNAGVGKTVTVAGIRLSGQDAGNYVVNNTASTTASIAQAALTVKVDNAEKDQGRINPVFTAGYSGLVGGDTLGAEVNGSLVFNTPATTASAAGNYLVSASGQTSNNYALNYVDGVLKINPTEALQAAIANVIAAVAVAPSQGNMVQADTVVSGEAVPAAPGVLVDVKTGNAPVVQLAGNVVTNVLPGLRLSVVDTGLRLPAVTGGSSSQESP